MTRLINDLQPARAIIDEFGGCRPLARAIQDASGGSHKITPSAISRWTRPTVDGGTNGRIPMKHWAILLTAAHKLGKADRVRVLLDQHLEFANADRLSVKTPGLRGV